ncbi:T9SS type B sorting domain-containing protein [Croceitalea vernalis]|uniref:T9SS type B sorting domain-containing protein n=1 Tax=Croceitalea vernalis TaxID=3075599 RepID=A0ABU3BIZ4_9FLAO|nr:T9SS type B sorting domain-containing protein [Croceitalea sp. P007]MDT0622144.1 T9SS type B sorting domain-containing protein [Croceitalea sp. P007]
MKRKLLLILALCICASGFTQDCPPLLSPVSGQVDVPVDATITWDQVDGIPGYQILLGTAPGQSDLGQASVGSATSFTPETGLPENTEVFVTIILDFLFEGGTDIVCDSQSFTTVDVTTAPGCTTLRTPVNGSTGVSVFTNILWNYAATATSYDIIVGTAPGLGDIATTNVQSLAFNPAGEFPPDTLIYVEIIPRNENGTALSCTEFTFRTGAVAPLPSCTSLIQPLNGATNIPLTPLLEWVAVPGATGYRVTIGTTPDGSDVLNNATFFTNSTFVIDFEPNRTFFITITPFNDSGDAITCGQETFSTLLGCGPFLDQDTGEFVSLNPDITLPSVFSFCENSDPLTITAPIGADGYRWVNFDEFGTQTLLSELNEVTITQTGSYYLEAYTIISQPGGVIECPTILEFDVVSSEIATINNLVVSETALGLRIEVQVSGAGDYEYAIDDITGPYQDSNVFSAVKPGGHTLYVRDKNGCGIVEDSFVQDLTVEGFPKFFTPNGDSTNDFWQFIQPQGEQIILASIQIFDRYGTFIAEIDQNSRGWDGTFNGRPLPSGGYWFKAIDDNAREVQGFFTLKR